MVSLLQYFFISLFRLVEDGVVSAFLNLAPTLSKRKNTDEYVFHMLVCLASLSESSAGCRSDMILRGKWYADRIE